MDDKRLEEIGYGLDAVLDDGPRYAQEMFGDLLTEVKRLRAAIADHWQHADGNVVYCVFCGNTFAHEPDCVVLSVVPTEVSTSGR